MNAYSCVPGLGGRLPGAPWTTAALLAGACMALAAPASAQQRLVIESDPDTGSLDVGCQSLSNCDLDTDCEGDLVCGSVFGESLCSFSLEGKTEIICCDGQSTDICPTQNGTEGVCTPVGDTGTSVCVYPDLFTFCRDGTTFLSLDRVAACLTSGDADALSSDWSKGDCDGDGAPNKVDCFPCDPQRHDCPVVDAGVPEDAGVIIDPVLDAGDRGDPSTVSFEGKGGCSCGVASGPELAGRALPAVLVLGWLAAFRRRR